MGKRKNISIDKIKVDPRFFRKLRDGYDGDAIEDYKDLYRSGKQKLPPLVVQKQKKKFMLIDGFHRYKALTELGEERVDVEIIETEKPFVEAVKRNRKHGVRLSTRERNKCIERLYTDENLTQKKIGKIFGLSRRRIGQILGTEETSDTNNEPKTGEKDKRIKLNKAERGEVIEKCAKGEETQEEIGDEYNISQPRVAQIFSDFKNSVRSLYKEKGYPIELIEEEINPDISESKIKEILKGDEEINEGFVDVPRIICGDLFDKVDQVPKRSVDLIYVDPPYGITSEKFDQFENEEEYWEFTKRWLDVILPKLKDTGRLFVNFSQEKRYKFFKLMREFERKYDLKYTSTIIWNYRNNIKPHNLKKFKKTWEPIFFYRKRDAGDLPLEIGEKWGENINNYDCWRIPQPQTNYDGERKKFHPAQKPVELLRRIILVASREGDVVLDPMAGVGTTALACAQTGRDYVTIEREGEFVKKAKYRLREYL